MRKDETSLTRLCPHGLPGVLPETDYQWELKSSETAGSFSASGTVGHQIPPTPAGETQQSVLSTCHKMSMQTLQNGEPGLSPCYFLTEQGWRSLCPWAREQILIGLGQGLPSVPAGSGCWEQGPGDTLPVCTHVWNVSSRSVECSALTPSSSGRKPALPWPPPPLKPLS